jgi:hypothetical protein
MISIAIMRKLERKGYANLVYRSVEELDLINRAEVNTFLEPRDLIKFM